MHVICSGGSGGWRVVATSLARARGTGRSTVSSTYLTRMIRVVDVSSLCRARVMVARLIEAAAQPFLEMLAAWIYR